MEYYIVVEIQKSDGAPAVLTDSFADRNAAYNKFFSVLSYAAVSQVPYHGAYLLGGTETAEVFESRFFEH